MATSKFETITVGWDGSNITCSPEKTQLYYLSEPDSMQWVIASEPPGAAGFEVAFQGEGLFTTFAMSVDGTTKKLIATGNTMRRGSHKYTIRFYDAAGTVLAELDPSSENEPKPPGYPTYP